MYNDEFVTADIQAAGCYPESPSPGVPTLMDPSLETVELVLLRND